MKKQIKRFVLSVLVLTMVFSCIPATTYAKEQFKWSKSLVLKEKMYKTTDKYGNSYAGNYVVTFFSDRYAKVTVQNYNGCVYNYSRGSKLSNSQYDGEGAYPTLGYWSHTITDDKEQKKNAKATIEIDRGWNALMISPCTDVTLKNGQEFKCKLLSKDANLLFITSEKRVNVGLNRAPMFSKKKFAAFKKWWMPQYYSLDYSEGGLEADCKYAAGMMKSVGLSDLSKKELTTKIKKNVEKIYRQSNKNSKKFVSYQEAFVAYVNSIEGFKEKLVEKYGEKDAEYYWNNFYEYLNWYKEDVQEYK